MKKDIVHLLIIALLAVILVLSVVILNKLPSTPENYGRNLRDIGPYGATGDRASNPSNVFVQSCRSWFDNGCANGSNVCGDDDKAFCQDNTDMSDMSCYGAKYVAYQRSDCDNPYLGSDSTKGYLCGGTNCPAQIPDPLSGIKIIGDAPSNPWGCEKICA